MVLETPPPIHRPNNIFMNPNGISGMNINNNLNQNVNYNMNGFHNNHNGMNNHPYSHSNHSGLHSNNMHLGSNVMGCRSQTKLHQHPSASTNYLEYNHNNYAEDGIRDEQLLEGLPGDESMSRLF